jgi:response regulator of citrate/malate metabolism
MTMLKILIVEDDARLASTLKYLIEDNPRYRVVGTAEDLAGTIAAVEREEPDLALVDLHLARGSTGFSVAVRLNDGGIPCLFVTGKAPAFAMPDLALGCLLKPFTGEEVHRALAMAEDMMRGRETLRPRVPANLQIYNAEAEPAFEGQAAEQQLFVPARRSLTQRLGQWIVGAAY